jgi:hypothetical protein
MNKFKINNLFIIIIILLLFILGILIYNIKYNKYHENFSVIRTIRVLSKVAQKVKNSSSKIFDKKKTVQKRYVSSKFLNPRSSRNLRPILSLSSSKQTSSN